MTTKTEPARLLWIDMARGLGILLVFYGHFVERLYDAGHTAAFLQFKLIYAFHMPLFFILTGYIQKSRGTDFREFLKRGVMSRLVPVLFFNLVGLLVLLAQDAVRANLDIKRYAFDTLSLVRGYPAFNFVTWFVICLFAVECLHFFVGQHAQTHRQVAVSALCFFLAGWLITWKIGFVVAATGITKNFWFVHEALVAYAFFQLGLLWRRWQWFRQGVAPIWLGGLLILTGAIVLATFNLNGGPFVVLPPVVVMADSSHGHILLFPLTAISGTALVMAAAKLLPPSRPMLYLGQNSLILMGLNGLFFTFVNTPVARWSAGLLADTPVAALLASGLVTLASILVSMPLVALLNKYLPQLVGKPQVNGPWLRNLIAEKPAASPLLLSEGQS